MVEGLTCMVCWLSSRTLYPSLFWVACVLFITTSPAFQHFFTRDCLLWEEESKPPGWAWPITSHMKLQMEREMVSSKSGRSFSTNYGVARSVAGELEIRSWGIAEAVEEVLCPEWGHGWVKLLDLYFRVPLQCEKGIGSGGHTRSGKNSLQDFISNPGQRRWQLAFDISKDHCGGLLGRGSERTWGVG